MRKSTSIAAAAGLWAALITSCSGERWQIGIPVADVADAGSDLDASSAALCGSQALEGIPPEPSAPRLGAGHTGNWSARLSGEEAGKFPSNRLQLSLSPADPRLVFETADALPSLGDGRAGYLCHAPGASTCASESGFVPAFEYPLWDVAARGGILSFAVLLEQPWNEWCQLQAPVAQEIPGCDPFYDVEAAYAEVRWGDPCAVRRGDEWTEIDCDRLATLERHVCVCSAESCRAAARALQVNLRLVAPDVLEGALWFAADHAQVLHFERQPSVP